MINLNLKYNNDDFKKCKKQLKINRVENKNCWIKKWIAALAVYQSGVGQSVY